MRKFVVIHTDEWVNYLILMLVFQNYSHFKSRNMFIKLLLGYLFTVVLNHPRHITYSYFLSETNPLYAMKSHVSQSQSRQNRFANENQIFKY